MGSSQSIPVQQGHSNEQSGSKISQCPIQHHPTKIEDQDDRGEEKFNELNNMPYLPQTRSPSQRTALSLERTLSSIPRSPSLKHTAPQDSDQAECSSSSSACPVNHQSGHSQQKRETWVYPSPQQFYNALVRKGYPAPEESVPVMVDIHNWMNEAVWNEVLRWESRYFSNFHAASSSGTDRTTPLPASEPMTPEISLAKFQGRPQDLSPKARFHLLLSKVFPNVYSPYKPFDRHDWLISRDFPNSSQNEHEIEPKLCRYVIDYYDGGKDEDGNPVFHFDVRPAIDDLESLAVRLKEWARVKNETWFKTDTVTSSNPTQDMVKEDSKI